MIAALALALAAGAAGADTLPPTPVVDVAALIAHGCFSCLERALAATG